MNLLVLAWKNIFNKPLSAFINLLLLALGVGMVSLLLVLRTQTDDILLRNSKGIDFVIGAKGSPVQLILANIFHLDNPTGNISLATIDSLRRMPVYRQMIKRDIPLSYGDFYKAYRILGTDTSYVSLYNGTISQGRLWRDPFEVTIGAQVAARHNLGLGDTFLGSHGDGEGGKTHEGKYYKVVGILAPNGSVLDKLVLTPLESVWLVHELEEDQATTTDPAQREITALLVQKRSPMALFTLPRLINKQTSMQLASPVIEVRRLQSLFDGWEAIVRGLAIAIMVISGLSVFIMLLERLQDRNYELALMRSMGASKGVLLQLLLLEGIILAILGGLLGIVLGKLGLWLIAQLFLETYQISISTWFVLTEAWLVGAAILIGLLAALVPAFQASNLNISRTLAEG